MQTLGRIISALCAGTVGFLGTDYTLNKLLSYVEKDQSQLLDETKN